MMRVLVKDISPGSSGSGIQSMGIWNGRLFLGAGTASTGAELMISDGTQAGTIMIQDIEPGSGSSSPEFHDCRGSDVLYSRQFQIRY